jgi:hypothetical protein
MNFSRVFAQEATSVLLLAQMSHTSDIMNQKCRRKATFLSVIALRSKQQIC